MRFLPGVNGVQGAPVPPEIQAGRACVPDDPCSGPYIGGGAQGGWVIAGSQANGCTDNMVVEEGHRKRAAAGGIAT